MKTYPTKIFVFFSTVMVAILWAALVTEIFNRSPRANFYRAGADRLKDLSQNSSEKLDRMIENNGVTWDPSLMGQEFTRVLTHLRRSPLPKILILGSSQFLVARPAPQPPSPEERIDFILSRKLHSRYDVLNLSLGAMTLKEQTIVLARVFEVIAPKFVVLGMSPMSSDSEFIRESLGHLPADLAHYQDPNAPKFIPTPQQLNLRVSAWLGKLLSRRWAFLQNRSAIQLWIYDGVKGATEPLVTWWRGESPVLSPTLSKKTGDFPIPVQYRFDGAAQARSFRNLDELFGVVAKLQKNYSGTRFLLFELPLSHRPGYPPCLPVSFHEEFKRRLERFAARRGLAYVDASRVLPPEHFGQYFYGEDAGKGDIMHFDARGHHQLADLLIKTLKF